MIHAFIRAVVQCFAAAGRGWGKVRVLFVSGFGSDNPSTDKPATREQREVEAERIDRLRNPSNYEGK